MLGSEALMEIYYVVKDMGYPSRQEILERIANQNDRNLRKHLGLLMGLDLILAHQESNKRKVYYVRPGRLDEYYELIRKL